ncbi:MAG: hypothetical protein QOJ98_2870 [Acidobacteriota bacterium]|jgi:uncharacterized protein (DUF58 family)|nr:hypothetical protein [Acidobacteriota bacterium]
MTTAALHPFEFNGVVRLTKVGTTYILGTVILAVAAINTGNNAIYIAVALMLGCLLLSGIASKGGLKHLHVEIRGIDEAWAGRPADGMLRIRNDSRIWNVRDVVLFSEGFAAPVLVPLIARRSEILVNVQFVFPRRGLAHVNAIDSYTRYPFGFFLKKRRLRVASEVIVYPRLVEEDIARERFRPVIGEESTVTRPGAGSELHSFREYVRGDSLRQVHWKKSASLGRWIMKQYEAEASRSVLVVVDPYKPRTASDEELEEMISSAATFIYDAARRGLDVTLLLPRVTLRARESESASPLFRALALLEPLHEPVHQLLERDAVLFAVSRSAA